MVETDREAAEELAALIDAETPVVALAPPYEPRGCARTSSSGGSGTRWSRCSRARTG